MCPHVIDFILKCKINGFKGGLVLTQAVTTHHHNNHFLCNVRCFVIREGSNLNSIDIINMNFVEGLINEKKKLHS